MTTMLVIEAGMAGLVIGRGGSKIKSIQQESGTVIKLIDGDTADTRKVKIIGPEGAQLTAAKLIEKAAGRLLDSKKVEDNRSRQPQQRKKKPRGSQREASPLEQISFTDEQWEELTKYDEERQRKLMDSLVPIIKDFYVEHEEVKAMSVEDVNAFRLAQNKIMVEYIEGADDARPIPKPIKTFKHAFHAYPEILKVIKKQNFTVPSPVQCQAWPIILSGHDLIAIAQTGTGKTLAYILPALIHLLRQPTPRKERIGPSVVILCPTRELVIQIENEIKKYIFDEINILSIYGGVSLTNQLNILLESKPEIIAATPGRLNEIIGLNCVKLDHVSYLVLDEADRMLDMGFKTQIELSLRDVRPDRQTILTSATWPIGVRQLANNYTKNPLHITIGSFDLTTVNTVEQKIIVLKEHEKEAWLDNYITKTMSKNDKVIIFMRKKDSVDKLYEKLITQNIKCRCMHGGRVQIDREASLADMRNGTVSVLIATDVASRGLDIQGISLVLNYDFPLHIEEYVHRVGRTGRAGKKGLAITLFSNKDRGSALSLVNVLKSSNQPVPKELSNMVSE